MTRFLGPHRRYNPLFDEWVLCSPQRINRPWQGLVAEPPPSTVPAYDAGCYLCPGNLRVRGERNPDYTGTFAFQNDFPAVGSGRDEAPVDDGLLRAHAEAGVCRVICFTPRHDLSVARMPTADIRAVVDCWAEESAVLGRRSDVAHVQVFENKGEFMGCSNPHPHSQIWATGHLPTRPAQLLATQQAYIEKVGRDLLGDYLEQEIRLRERIILENDSFVALVPFWATWPFETMLIPRRPVRDLPSLDDAEREDLADGLRRLTIRYDNLFRTDFPYSMGFAQQPTDGLDHPEWRLHASFYPPLLRSATVRKFLVGYEMMAEVQRDLSAEVAAERLRGCDERHYRDA